MVTYNLNSSKNRFYMEIYNYAQMLKVETIHLGTGNVKTVGGI